MQSISSEINSEDYLIVFKSDGKNYSGSRGGQGNDNGDVNGTTTSVNFLKAVGVWCTRKAWR